MPVTIAARAVERFNISVESSNSARGMAECPRVFSVLLCRYRPYDGLILHPKSPLNDVVLELILYQNKHSLI
jgi:hypothetical protein